MHIYNKKKDILVLSEGPTQGFVNTKITTTKYPINFVKRREKSCFSLHYNGSNSFFVNTKKYINSKCLGNNKNDFTVNKMKKTGLNEYVLYFSIDDNIIDVSNINCYNIIDVSIVILSIFKNV